MQRLNRIHRAPFVILLVAGAVVLQACGSNELDDDTSKPVMMTPTQPQIADWKDFKGSAVPVAFKIPTSAQVVHDNNQMLLVMYIDDGCQLTVSGIGIGSDPAKAREFVAGQAVEETTGKAIVSPPRDYPLKGGAGTYWADKVGNIKRKHRMLFAHAGWCFEVAAECDGDTIPDSLKPLFDAITIPPTAAENAAAP